MYKHILIPTDGSGLSGRVIAKGVALAGATGARVIGFIATPAYRAVSIDPMMVPDTAGDFARDSSRRTRRALSAVKRAAAAGVRCSTEHIVADQPWKAIIRAARRNRCALICMASQGRKGLAGILLGSETNKALMHSKVPVLVCR